MPYPTHILYDIVNRVEAYPEFLPWCGGSRVLARTKSTMDAAVLMQKGPLNHWFSTHNRLSQNRSIEMQLIDGPFQKLEGCWQFQAFGADTSKIELVLEFEFSRGPAAMLLAPIFSRIANTMVDSFCARALQLENS